MTTTPAGTGSLAGAVRRPLRRDAARNRRLIIDAATAVLAEQGVQASMNDIARRAGVGVGTVYRRFPERGGLVRAVFEQRLAAVGEITAAAAADPDAWHGLVGWLEDTITSEVEDLGLSQLLDDAELREWVIGSADPIREGIERLLGRARAAGQLRADVGLADVVLVKHMVVAIARLTDVVDPRQWRRTLALALDGLRSGQTSPLPGRALTPDGLLEIMRASRL